jgi:predicted metalloprotease
LGGGGGGGGGLGGGKLGLGGIVILLVLSLVFKQDFLGLAGGGGGAAVAPAAEQAAPLNDAREEPLVQFVSFVLDDTQAFWQRAFASEGGQYRDARLVLFRDQTPTACGTG